VVAVLAAWLLAACGGTSSSSSHGAARTTPAADTPIASGARPDPSTSPPTPPTPPLESSAALAPELVGAWETQHWLDSTGSQAILRVYRFTADGRYEYTLAQCRSSTDCTVQGFEAGTAQAAGGILSLRPQTASTDGPRTYPYVVGRDPDVGDLQLHLTLAGGQVDVFYAA